MKIHSRLEIREFPSLESEVADLTIVFGDVPPVLSLEARKRSTMQAVPGQFQMEVPNVGRFLARHGTEIVIDRFEGASDELVVVYTVGSLIAAILQQRHCLTLHASCIKGPEGAVAFIGSSGMGKSTLMSAMNQRGYGMIADNITALQQTVDGSMHVLPAAPFVRLWVDSAGQLGRGPGEGWRIRNELKKYSLPVENFWSEPSPISQMFFLSNPGTGDIGVVPLNRMRAFHELRKLTYRHRFMSLMGMDVVHFNFLNQMIADVPVARLVRPIGAFDLDTLANVVENAINNRQAPEC